MRSPSISPSISDKDSYFINPRRDVSARVHFSQASILRALSHTVAIYDPEQHPNKKYSVRPYMQIDASVHTLDDSAALTANLVVFSPISTNKINKKMDQDHGPGVQLDKGFAAEGAVKNLKPVLSIDGHMEQAPQDIEQSGSHSTKKVHGDHFDLSLYYPIRTYAHQTVEELMKKIFKDETVPDASSLETRATVHANSNGPDWDQNMKNPDVSTVSHFDKMSINDPTLN